MIIEYILIGFILLIFLVDVLRKKNYNSKEIIKAEINDKTPNSFISILIITLIGLVIGIIVDFAINNNTYSENVYVYIKKFRYTNAAFFNYVISFFITLILGVYLVSFRNKNFIADLSKRIKNLVADLSKRKKNITLSILIVIPIKILLHFFLYPIRYSSYRVKGFPEHLKGTRKDLGVHINEVFSQELQLFIPSLILVLFFAWFFNDKIKAR